MRGAGLSHTMLCKFAMVMRSLRWIIGGMSTMGGSVHLAADFVWPVVALVQGMYSVVPIVAGLIVEWLALWLGGFGMTWKKAIVVDVVMNAASALLGFILIPLLGMGWEMGPGQFIERYAPLGLAFNLPWAAAFVIAVCVTTAIEASVVRWGFKIKLGVRRFLILFGANAITVWFGFISISAFPWHHGSPPPGPPIPCSSGNSPC